MLHISLVCMRVHFVVCASVCLGAGVYEGRLRECLHMCFSLYVVVCVLVYLDHLCVYECECAYDNERMCVPVRARVGS